MRGFISLLLLGIVAAALFVVAGAAAIREGGPFLLRANSIERRVAAMQAVAEGSSPISPLESHYARTARLDACMSTLRDVAGTVATPRSTIDSVTRGCLGIAEAIVAQSPLESNVWYIAATLAARLGDLDTTSRFLVASFRTGPAEQWIAERRALFAYSLRDRLDESLNAMLDRDLALLLRTERGLTTLASRYVSDPEMRDYIVVVAESLDEVFQRRLLSRIKSEMDSP